MSHENVSGTESSVIPGTEDAAASCVVFMTTVVQEPSTAPGSIHPNTYWALTLYPQSYWTQSWNWPSPSNPASDKLWVGGKWMKIESKWVNFTNPGPKLEQKTMIISRAWTLQWSKAMFTSQLHRLWARYSMNPLSLFIRLRTGTSHGSVCDIRERYVKLLKCLVHDNQSRTLIKHLLYMTNEVSLC